MFKNIHERMQIFNCTFDINTNGNTQKTSMQAPRMIIEQQFVSLIQQAAQSNSPVEIKISRMVPVYDEVNNGWIERENYIVFANNAWENYKHN